MRGNRMAFAGWPGGARAIAPELLRERDAQVGRQLDFLLRVFTPRTVFMDIGSSDCELSLRAAGYVERVWCVDAQSRANRPPCNLRWGVIGGVPVRTIDVAFSECLKNSRDVRRLLKAGGVWFIRGEVVPAPMLRNAGFSRVVYYAGALRLPAALARIARSPTTAAYN